MKKFFLGLGIDFPFVFGDAGSDKAGLQRFDIRIGWLKYIFIHMFLTIKYKSISSPVLALIESESVLRDE